MGQAKRHMERVEEQQQVATGIAVQAGVLERCDYHLEWVRDKLGDRAAAYKLANHKFTKGELGDTFSTRQELTDTVKEVIESAPDHGCPSCGKWEDD